MIVWAKEYNKLNHTNITKNQITLWDIGKILPMLPAEISGMFNDVWNLTGKGFLPQKQC